MHHHFTFRPSTTGMAEERLIRGLHPYIAQRMQLERLRKFDLTRLPSSDEEVYLFRCVARENPSDDRLVAFAQVRDLTALRDHEGRLVALPTAGNVVATCVDSMRLSNAHGALSEGSSDHRPAGCIPRGRRRERQQLSGNLPRLRCSRHTTHAAKARGIRASPPRGEHPRSSAV